MSEAQVREYRFGHFRLLPAERQLFASGRPAKLGARAFDLLLTLVERRDRTVTRAELFDLVWSGRVVEDQNLQVQVVALRKVLGPNAIATVPGRGYRFTLPLAEQTPGVDASHPATPAGAAFGSSNLPPELPPLYGRTQDIVDVIRLLGEARLVTLAGPGGIGKTQLAKTVAHQLRTRYPEGVWFVDFAALAEAGAAASTVARTVGLAVGPETSTAEGVARALRLSSLLLVLDNCEHLLDATTAIARAVLHGAPRVTLLVTSQEPMKIPEERVFRLAGLPSPQDDDASVEYGAVALFAARVRALLPQFAVDSVNRATVIDICRRLDGIPLALELAAGRVPLLGVEGVRARLDERLRLLASAGRGVSSRHRTLRAALEWSHALLDNEQRVVFRRLGAFAAGASIEMAQSVIADDAIDAWAVLDQLGALVDKSLVQALVTPTPRVGLLETMRSFAREQLEAHHEVRAVNLRLAQSLADLFERWDAEYLAAPAFDWLGRSEPELDNVRAALRWACGADGNPLLAVALAGSCVGLWVLLDLVDEAGEWFDAIEPFVDERVAPAQAARFWLALAQIGGTGVARSIPPRRAAVAARKALALYRELDDPLHQYWALNFLIPLAERAGESMDADAAIAEMRDLLRPEWPAHVGRLLRATEARRLARLGRWPEYRDAFAREVGLLEDRGDLRAAWLAAQSLALAELRLGNPDGAIVVLERVVTQARNLGKLRETWTLLGLLASALIDKGDTERAATVVRELVALVRAVGSLAWGIDYLSTYVAQCGRWEDAGRLHGWSDAQAAARGETRGPVIREAHARLREQLQRRFPAEKLAQLLEQGARLHEDEVAVLICPIA